ncbi:pseudouridine-5'-phosphate glycosidase [Sneathiella limimaris]|uniref:pseudouridine-5'-phosphate glycosidase n=1 Tax=Sneathiella limimaris TaxID=1964213 RepID=UPI00146D06FB|nr:pseudouridine-5'-phosphate glycosidase [Sneathiella limimaris]
MKLSYSAEVAEALKNGVPIVALESTIISHGFPYPKNVELAEEMETIIRENGAIPATIAIIRGKITVGLELEELLHLAKSGDVRKCSVRDLSMALVDGVTGATTVASTSFIAARAGIRVFATGGIGGVHKAEEGANGFDVSADLLELSRTGVAVVAAGAKSILDLPATLEVLESFSVPVIGYQTDTFPAFHCRSSGLKLPAWTDNIGKLADIVDTHLQLGSGSGMLICNPVPEAAAMTNDEVDELVMAAQREAVGKGIKGAALTPYILGALDRLSKGRTSEVNLALALNNGKVAAELASCLAR